MLDTKIETFLTVCKHMNFTKAAEELHLTQPAVSSQMKRLEEYYKTPLFKYKNKQLILAEVGKAVFLSMKQMENQETYLREQIHFLRTKRREIKYGATKTIGEFLLADAMQEYLTLYPDSFIHMQVANTKNLLGQLDDGNIDFAFVEGNYSKSKYKSYPFKNSRFIPVCGVKCLLKNGKVTLEELFRERLIIREQGSGTRDIFERILNGKNHEIKDFSGMVEVGNMNVIKELLLRSVGISFLYEDVVKTELEKKEVFEIPLSGWNVSHRMNVIWRRENEHIGLMEEFLNVLKR